jgi:uncharacterized protein HemX
MKLGRLLLLAMLIGMGVTATAQQRLVNLNGREQLRLRELKLTMDQKRKLAILIQRERMQFYLNQKELNEILTEKQKAMLLDWRNKQMGNKSDSAEVKR